MHLFSYKQDNHSFNKSILPISAQSIVAFNDCTASLYVVLNQPSIISRIDHVNALTSGANPDQQ